MKRDKNKDRLNRQFDQLARKMPQAVANALLWLRKPNVWLVRVPLGLLLMVGGVFSFLPILGIWMLPLGMLFLAVDIPLLRGPITRLITRLQQLVRYWWTRRKNK